MASPPASRSPKASPAVPSSGVAAAQASARPTLTPRAASAGAQASPSVSTAGHAAVPTPATVSSGTPGASAAAPA
ncbi:hypothetical protein PINS_up023697, partial [Pythium insidiosum]